MADPFMILLNSDCVSLKNCSDFCVKNLMSRRTEEQLWVWSLRSICFLLRSTRPSLHSYLWSEICT